MSGKVRSIAELRDKLTEHGTHRDGCACFRCMAVPTLDAIRPLLEHMREDNHFGRFRLLDGRERGLLDQLLAPEPVK